MAELDTQPGPSPAILADPVPEPVDPIDPVPEQDPIVTAAEAFRTAKEADPAFTTARKAAQLNQAVSNFKYYSGLAAEAQAEIKRLTAELDDGSKDPNLAAIMTAVP